MEKFQFKGYWWLPSNSEVYSPGTLKYESNNTGTIEVICNDAENWRKIHHNDIILGLANNTEFTLCNCEVISDSLLSDTPTMLFRIKFIIKGKQFESRKAITIKNAQVTFDYLSYWTNAEYSILRFKKDNTLKKQPITLLPPKKIKIPVNSNFNLYFVNTHHFNYSSRSLDINIKKYGYFDMQFINAISLDEFYQYLDQLNKFYCFSIQNVAYPISIFADKTKNDFNFEIIIKKKYSKNSEKDHLQRSDMLFMFDDIENDLNKIIPNWFNNYNTLDNIYTLYFGDLFGNQFLETKFLTMIQIIEAYHRTIFPKAKPKIPKDEFKKRRDLILNLIPSNDYTIYKDWLSKSLINSPSLKQRLEDLFERFENILINFNNADEFVNVVVYTRNSMSHALKKKEKKKSKALVAKEFHNLYNLYMKSKLIVDVCFLNGLELQEETIIRFLNNLWKYDSIMKGKDYFESFGLITKDE